MARPRSGSLYWTKLGWRARLTIDVDGVQVRQPFDLETTDTLAARVKLARLLEKPPPAPAELAAEAKRVETFAEAAKRIVDASGIRSAAPRLARLKNHAFRRFGPKPVSQVTASDVEEMRDAIAKAGGSKQSCLHLRNDVSAVLGELHRLGVVPANVSKNARIPKTAKIDRRERAVLTDDEPLAYLAWSHPVEREQDAVRERQTMACVSRVFGGLRLGDLREMRWEVFHVAGGGAFAWGWAPRRKTERPQQLEIPGVLRPILRDWWERAGRPVAGPCSPSGAARGQGRPETSTAALRRRYGATCGARGASRAASLSCATARGE